ncbi:MAG: hypothetical protein AAF601_01045 [Pseudomonadota bacterium]
MKNVFYACAVLALCTGTAQAQCYADYKAKKDDPLRLHYGVAQISGACNVANASAKLTPRLAQRGWVLLQVQSVFGPEGLDQRKDSAGSYYLRF